MGPSSSPPPAARPDPPDPPPRPDRGGAARDLLVAVNADESTGPRLACHLGALLAAGDGAGDPEHGPLAAGGGEQDPAGGPAGSGDPEPALRATGEMGAAARELARRLGVGAGGSGGARQRSLAELAGEVGLPMPLLARAREIAAQSSRLAATERRRAADLGAAVLTRLDPGYPPALLDLALPPPVLYLLGELPETLARGRLGLTVVGARRADRYGLDLAHRISRSLAALGLTVVSGLARGVDAAAHRGALAGAGTTVAVLGSGLGVDYPRGHARLRREIAASGALLTEFPVGLQPRRWHFPVRNRLLAALTPGTLVVQATERSGSLVTARWALDLGRDVLAVPGPVGDRHSRGPHRLLRDGAALVTDARDVLDALVGPSVADELLAAGGLSGGEEEERGQDNVNGDRSTKEGVGGSGRAGAATDPRGRKGKVLAALSAGLGRAPEEIADEVGAGVDSVLGALMELEIEGWVRREPGPRFFRTQR